MERQKKKNSVEHLQQEQWALGSRRHHQTFLCNQSPLRAWRGGTGVRIHPAFRTSVVCKVPLLWTCGVTSGVDGEDKQGKDGNDRDFGEFLTRQFHLRLNVTGLGVIQKIHPRNHKFCNESHVCLIIQQTNINKFVFIFFFFFFLVKKTIL